MCENIKEEQELHPIWQLLIKLLFIIGTSAAVITAFLFCIVALLFIGNGVNSVINFLLGG